MIEGAKALLEVSKADERRDLLIIVTSIALLESELSQWLIRYQAFLEVPQRLEALDAAATKLAESRAPGDIVAPE